ncbi:hypothetical protein L5515_010197 [Caenorhabditis briggsae]|uniref:Methyltransferase FkbM domain-containing protein n=1 Tax=Caenorhabditis briggsae TaxID=6238 RepID=A0AAE9ELI4_CAEBR|nr:hypothetical protein L5515_010197 [Caenorhabditis briggsae]
MEAKVMEAETAREASAATNAKDMGTMPMIVNNEEMKRLEEEGVVVRVEEEPRCVSPLHVVEQGDVGVGRARSIMQTVGESQRKKNIPSSERLASTSSTTSRGQRGWDVLDKKLHIILDYHKASNYPILDKDSAIQELRKNALLSADQTQRDILASSIGNDTHNFYRKLKLEAFCTKKMKIGERKDDGGKVVCNPEAVKEDCTLMSLGLNNQVQFDQEIYNATGRKCDYLAADMDPQNMNTYRIFAGMQAHVHTGKIPDNLTIAHIMEVEFKKELEILKIDIEGGEHTGLEPFLKEYYVCQILIEIHGLPADHLNMLQKIARFGFRIFNIEPNKMCSRCCEYSMINELCMPQFETVPLAIIIPRNLTVV